MVSVFSGADDLQQHQRRAMPNVFPLRFSACLSNKLALVMLEFPQFPLQTIFSYTLFKTSKQHDPKRKVESAM